MIVESKVVPVLIGCKAVTVGFVVAAKVTTLLANSPLQLLSFRNPVLHGTTVALSEDPEAGVEKLPGSTIESTVEPVLSGWNVVPTLLVPGARVTADTVPTEELLLATHIPTLPMTASAAWGVPVESSQTGSTVSGTAPPKINDVPKDAPSPFGLTSTKPDGAKFTVTRPEAQPGAAAVNVTVPEGCRACM